jgi:hypothetical protein
LLSIGFGAFTPRVTYNFKAQFGMSVCYFARRHLTAPRTLLPVHTRENNPSFSSPFLTGFVLISVAYEPRRQKAVLIVVTPNLKNPGMKLFTS